MLLLLLVTLFQTQTTLGQFRILKAATQEALELLRQKNGAMKAREKRRINSLQILQFDTRDIELINKQHCAVQEFGAALGLNLRTRLEKS